MTDYDGWRIAGCALMTLSGLIALALLARTIKEMQSLLKS